MENKSLWEILVPASDNEGNDFAPSHHRRWDKRVEKISGGLTILHATKGRWRSPSGEQFFDKMIPVRIACTKSEIENISEMTAKHYRQKVVMFYCLSELVCFRTYDEQS